MKIICPNCGRVGNLGDDALAVTTVVRCPSCKQKFSPRPTPRSVTSVGKLAHLVNESPGPDLDSSGSDGEPEYSVTDPVDRGVLINFRSSGRPEKEPWFYAFLWKEGENVRFLAKFLWYLNLVAYGLFAVFVIATPTGRKVIENFNLESTALVILDGSLFTIGYFLAAYLEWYSFMSLAAWIMILVDHARNVRRSRMADEKLANL